MAELPTYKTEDIVATGVKWIAQKNWNSCKGGGNKRDTALEPWFIRDMTMRLKKGGDGLLPPGETPWMKPIPSTKYR